MNAPNFLNRTLWIDDNLKILRGINSECIDLVCLDPPFNSQRLYNAPFGSAAAGAQFVDTWSMDGVNTEWTELQAYLGVHGTTPRRGLARAETHRQHVPALRPPRLALPQAALRLHLRAPHLSLQQTQCDSPSVSDT